MKWILVLLNAAAVLAFVGLRQYAYGYHHMEVEDAYQGLISRGLLDEQKAEEYARLHNGWHPRQRLNSIGNPDGFVQAMFLVGVGACTVDAAAVLLLCSGRRKMSAEPVGSSEPRDSASDSNRPSVARGP